MPDRTHPPASEPVSRFDFPKAKTTISDNGIPVHVIKAGNHNIIRLEIILKSGKWIEEVIGSSFFCNKLMLEGTKTKSSLEISEFFDRYGAYFEVYPGMDFVNFTLYSLNRHLETLLPVVFEVITQPTLPPEELETLKNIKIQQLKVEEEKNSFVASRKFRELIFGGEHPYGTDLTIESIDNVINREVLVDFYKNFLVSSPEIIVSGDINEKHLDQILNVFNEMKYRKIDIPEYNRSSLKIHHLDILKDESVQVSLRYGIHMVNKGHNDYMDLLILNELFGGYFGSRLMKSIREEKGYTYGIYSSMVSLIHDAYFVIASDVKKEFSEQVVMEIQKEIRLLQEKPVANNEIDTVRNYMTGTFLSSLETSFALADKFKSTYLYGLDYSYYDQFLDRIANITPERIRDLANKYLIPESFKLVTVG
jgi:predicted Zn-dependent peptidase